MGHWAKAEAKWKEMCQIRQEAQSISVFLDWEISEGYSTLQSHPYLTQDHMQSRNGGSFSSRDEFSSAEAPREQRAAQTMFEADT